MNMKKYIIALCLLITGTTGLMAQVKLGHVDRQDLMLKLPERPVAEEKMKKFAGELDTRLKAMGTEYQTKVADVQGRFETMTQTEKDAAQREVAEMEERITKAQETAKEDLSKMEQELLAPMVERTDKAIKEVAGENNFTYIFDTSTGMVLYWEKGEDIAPLVKKKLNVN